MYTNWGRKKVHSTFIYRRKGKRRSKRDEKEVKRKGKEREQKRKRRQTEKRKGYARKRRRNFFKKEGITREKGRKGEGGEREVNWKENKEKMFKTEDLNDRK